MVPAHRSISFRPNVPLATVTVGLRGRYMLSYVPYGQACVLKMMKRVL